MVSRLASTPNRVGLIGFGAIGSEVCHQLNNLKAAAPATVTSILVRDRQKAEKALANIFLHTGSIGGPNGGSNGDPNSKNAGVNIEIFDKPDHFLAAGERGDWNLCVEAAGQPALKEYKGF